MRATAARHSDNHRCAMMKIPGAHFRNANAFFANARCTKAMRAKAARLTENYRCAKATRPDKNAAGNAITGNCANQFRHGQALEKMRCNKAPRASAARLNKNG